MVILTWICDVGPCIAWMAHCSPGFIALYLAVYSIKFFFHWCVCWDLLGSSSWILPVWTSSCYDGWRTGKNKEIQKLPRICSYLSHSHRSWRILLFYQAKYVGNMRGALSKNLFLKVLSWTIYVKTFSFFFFFSLLSLSHSLSHTHVLMALISHASVCRTRNIGTI